MEPKRWAGEPVAAMGDRGGVGGKTDGEWLDMIDSIKAVSAPGVSNMERVGDVQK